MAVQQLLTPTEIRRREVYDLLRQALDEKLMIGGEERAHALLKEAYDRSRKPAPLLWPFPQATAYRLAYFEMRRAKTQRALERVGKLLDEAESGKILDPLQHALRIVLSERLRELAESNEKRKEYREASKKAFERLIGSAKEEDRFGLNAPLQSELFNVVELCAFLIGSDYALLEGRFRLYSRLFPTGTDSGCILVGTGGVDQDVLWSNAIARGEFEARIATGQIDIAFEWITEPTFVHPQRKKIQLGMARILPFLCAERDFRQIEPPNLHQNLKNLREGIANMLATRKEMRLENREVIQLIEGDRYRFHRQIRVLGLVSANKLA